MAAIHPYMHAPSNPYGMQLPFGHALSSFGRRESTDTLVEDVPETLEFDNPLKRKVLSFADANNLILNKSIKPVGPSATVCVVGVGYVGESLVKNFGRHYPTIGFDISSERIAILQKQLEGEENIRLTSVPSELAQATHFLVAIPTLVNPDNSIDDKPLKAALNTIVTFARPGSVIVIESSVYIGMTRKVLAPYYQEYHCGMSPERVDPGRISPAPHSIPKIISGLTPEALGHIYELYSPVFDELVPVSSPEVAEATKLYENCFRMINIAYVNEISDALEKQNINVKEVLDAASTKPFGFMPFSPGLGVGGNCIPINPHYLKVNCTLPVLETSTALMAERPAKLAKKFYTQVLNNLEDVHPLEMQHPRILVVGLGFKVGQGSIVESPAAAFAQELGQLGCATLDYYDPFVAQKMVPYIKEMQKSNWSKEGIKQNYDGVVVCVKQTGIDFTVLDGVNNVFVKWY